MKRLIGDRMNCNHYSLSIRRVIQRVSVKLLSCPPDGLTVDELCQYERIAFYKPTDRG